MANRQQLVKVKEGADAWNRWRRQNPGVRPHLFKANLTRANLYGANLYGAKLIGADLTWAHLTWAHLTWANLYGANLSRAILTGANLTEVGVSGTAFADVDLSQVKGLESVRHGSPSSIGVDTLARTLRGSGGKFTDEQMVFFLGAGVPDVLLEYLPSLLQDNPVQFYQCFISYSTRDEAFAARLNEDLNQAGVKTWKWNLDALPGRGLRDNIDFAIRNYDKMILVCSAHSLTSRPVEREIERALRKEDQLREQGNVDTDVLVPIMLDGFVLHWDSPYAADVTRYYIPDFSSATPDSAKYKQELDKLVEALNPKAWPPQGVNLPSGVGR